MIELRSIELPYLKFIQMVSQNLITYRLIKQKTIDQKYYLFEIINIFRTLFCGGVHKFGGNRIVNMHFIRFKAHIKRSLDLKMKEAYTHTHTQNTQLDI